MKHLLYAAAGLVAVTLLPATAKAQDASWGCQVLLCAASQKPSWYGVPYCVPPMKKLIAAMSKPGFSWPICHEAKAGTPGRVMYEDCPAGTKVSYSTRGREGIRGEPDQCVKTVNVCKERLSRKTGSDDNGIISYRRYSGRDGESCIQTVSTPRPRRVNPWFFDIPNDKGVEERFWFNLNT
ncbi:MAG: hypothetical protein E5X23_15665 [Mesorhizobium sp.]|uniref:hypothetical protein n=2 Tax=Mesorhizobium TaxID=68287 RepID=UPI000FCBD91D|nr:MULTISPECIES: hypothetical protein [unclassified Mesorhizobium]MCT2581293.1 hypothetical protein [Mesorhizobium sp. P13.3]MDF3170312.1 hypothetical protein [Mesorhizobium sp. P16.1]MDF3181227.1 hypothetical protein [Mesorhizobium sp. P17.1]MDF3187206.1 hypothetical protein [Mesorhizobium sp. ICCV3110.1]RUV55270.1 hypothetical protein EOA64_30760 [Mesorhizobium sp. M1A.F.Ca.IN.022.02.1.1]